MYLINMYMQICLLLTPNIQVHVPVYVYYHFYSRVSCLWIKLKKKYWSYIYILILYLTVSSHYRRPGESALPPPPGRTANGYEERRPEPPPAPAGTESFSSTYTSYYDRFYSKTAANGATAPPPRPSLGGQPAGRPALAGRPAPAAQRNDQQAALQTAPIYF